MTLSGLLLLFRSLGSGCVNWTGFFFTSAGNRFDFFPLMCNIGRFSLVSGC